MNTIAHLPATDTPRVVIAGGGFAGLQLVCKLRKRNFQVVLLDQQNYHQFQPLLYQVATAGLEPSAISFPLRKTFQKLPNVHYRMAFVERVDPLRKTVYTSAGMLEYDYLVLALGARTNYFGNDNIRQHAHTMKSVSEAIALRNAILSNFERAINEVEESKVSRLLNFVVVGGGPTGVELAGALAEMRKYILPKDYPELDFSQMCIYLLEASPRVLNGYTAQSSEKAKVYLGRLGVEVRTGTFVKDYNGRVVSLANGDEIETETMIWAAGIKAHTVEGLPEQAMGKGNRLRVDEFNRLQGSEDIFVLGDQALMTAADYPDGHPQVATVAMQQAEHLARNLNDLQKGKPFLPFRYRNKGALATIGRNLAVADLPRFRLAGFFAWLLWLFVHLREILGVRNKLIVFISWAWNYFTYDQSLRVLIRPRWPKGNSKTTMMQVETEED